eukprot:TRINITY_DN6195_c0_g1_i1.p1 TRINITY_DN6195_c0_g1~~TRINITY_DN6195_c0_g1_i1.p1  ORF type:complete len:259 (-),score=58.48 TRINITY_DN6195_c0_g1_i1:1006-1782(-)
MPKLIVKTLTGKHIRLDVEPNTTTAELKTLVLRADGIPEDQQRLIFNGYQLEDSRTMKDYGIVVSNESQQVSFQDAKVADFFASAPEARQFNGARRVIDLSKSVVLERYPSVHLVLRLRGGMMQISSGRNDFEDFNEYPEEQLPPIPDAVIFMPSEQEEEYEVILPDGRRSVIKAGRESTLESVQKRAEAAAPALSEQDLRQMTQEQLIQKYMALQQSMAKMQSAQTSHDAEWECNACTYINNGLMNRCEMCNGAKNQ